MWSVGLGELHDPDAVVDAVSSALTLREGQDAAPESLLVEYLAARKLLLVLDNCEHLVEPVAELAGTLLRLPGTSDSRDQPGTPRHWGRSHVSGSVADDAGIGQAVGAS